MWYQDDLELLIKVARRSGWKQSRFNEEGGRTYTIYSSHGERTTHLTFENDSRRIYVTRLHGTTTLSCEWVSDSIADWIRILDGKCDT